MGSKLCKKMFFTTWCGKCNFPNDIRNTTYFKHNSKKIAKSYYEYLLSVYNPEEKVGLGIPSHISAAPNWLNTSRRDTNSQEESFTIKDDLILIKRKLIVF